MNISPSMLRIAVAALLCSGLASAAISLPPPTVLSMDEPAVAIQVAGMLLMDEDVLADDDGTKLLGKVDSKVDVERVRQTSTGSLGSSQAISAGSASDSRITGKIETRVKVRSIIQSQSGRANQQNLDVGTVRDTHLTGTVKTHTELGQGAQSQSGVSNRQNVNFGSVQ